MDELAKPWIVVRNGQIIHADDSRPCAYAVAREAGATVYWCDGVIDGVPQLVQMADFEDGLYQLDDVAEDLTERDQDVVCLKCKGEGWIEKGDIMGPGEDDALPCSRCGGSGRLKGGE